MTQRSFAMVIDTFRAAKRSAGELTTTLVMGQVRMSSRAGPSLYLSNRKCSDAIHRHRADEWAAP